MWIDHSLESFSAGSGSSPSPSPTSLTGSSPTSLTCSCSLVLTSSHTRTKNTRTFTSVTFVVTFLSLVPSLNSEIWSEGFLVFVNVEVILGQNASMDSSHPRSRKQPRYFCSLIIVAAPHTLVPHIIVQTCHDPVLFSYRIQYPPLRFLGLQYPSPHTHNTVCNTSPLPTQNLMWIWWPKIQFFVCSIKTEHLETFRLVTVPLPGVALSDTQSPAARCVGS